MSALQKLLRSGGHSNKAGSQQALRTKLHPPLLHLPHQTTAMTRTPNGFKYLIEKWAPTINAILDATQVAFASSPPGTTGSEPDIAQFQFRQ